MERECQQNDRALADGYLYPASLSRRIESMAWVVVHPRLIFLRMPSLVCWIPSWTRVQPYRRSRRISSPAASWPTKRQQHLKERQAFLVFKTSAFSSHDSVRPGLQRQPDDLATAVGEISVILLTLSLHHC